MKDTPKNKALVWVRTQAGMNQAQAAAACGVERVQYNRWENGAVAMPEHKFSRFVKDCDLLKRDIPYFPPDVVYGPSGYPAGYAARATHPEDKPSLEAFEGKDYHRRELFRLEWRYRNVSTNWGENKEGKIALHMASWRALFARDRKAYGKAREALYRGIFNEVEPKLGAMVEKDVLREFGDDGSDLV